ncbi:MAG: cation:proton antiporter [Bryobacterales bacterium]
MRSARFRSSWLCSSRAAGVLGVPREEIIGVLRALPPRAGSAGARGRGVRNCRPLAGWLGISVAVGALFAGLMFSRDPEAVKLEAGFSTIYALFTPFFFLNIGFGFDPRALGSAAGVGVVLYVAAVVGKFFGAGFPLVFREGWKRVRQSWASAWRLGLRSHC